MKRLLCISALFLGSFCGLGTVTMAQDLPSYDLARAWAPQVAEQLMFSYTIRPNYFPESTKFWYSFKTSAGESWYIVDPVARTKTPIWNNDEMAALLTLETKDPYDGQHLPISQLSLNRDDSNVFNFSVKGKQFEYNYVKKTLTPAKPAARTPMGWGNVSPDGKWVLYGQNYNLFRLSYDDYKKLLANPKDSTIVGTQLTTTGVKDFSFQPLSSTTYSDGGPVKDMSVEKRRVSGFWSPDGRYYVQVVTDNRAIKDLWVINSIAQPRPTLETYKYQMPGEEGSVSHMYLFDMETKSMKEIKTEKYTNQSLSPSVEYNRSRTDMEKGNTWKGDKDWFYVTRIGRDMKNMDVCTYTLGQDSIVPIVHESSNTYLEYSSMRPILKNQQFVLWSERDGWGHLYLYDKAGNLKSRLTKGAWHVESILAVDEAQQVVYFTANGLEKNETTPYYEHVYRVNFNGSGLKLLTPGDYFHMAYMDEKKQFIVDNYSRVNTVPAIALYNNAGQKVMDLETADMSQLFAHGYKFPEPITVKAADGITDLYGVMYKPFDFDSTKVYPVVDYVYPGPQQEGNFFRYCPMNPRTDRLAQAGFIVIAVGQRGGTPARSKWYHNYGYGNLRDYPLADHKAAIEQLCAKYSFMDVNKVGIHGHSGGGFMSTAAMLVYPDFFKAAVSCAGNHDNNIYNRSWSERHHGVTERVDDKGKVHWDIKVPVNQDLAKNLKGHLLLIHGDVDDNVHPGNTIRVVNELIKAGKRFDMLIMPGKQHHFEDYNEYFYWKLVDYFSKYLKGEAEESVDIKGIKLGNWFQGYQD